MRLLVVLATSVVVMAACGDDGTHRLDQLQVQNVDVTTAEDTPLSVTIPVQAAADRTIAITITTPPMHGTLAASPDATTWTYTPAANYDGSDAVNVQVSDGNSTADGSIAITVTPVDDAPVALPDLFTTGENAPVAITTAQLLANDMDVESDVLGITAVDGAQHGTVVLDGTSITFTPETAFIGAASFTYTLSDGAVSSTGTVTVTVVADTAPVATADTVTTAEDTTLTIAAADLIANDTDAEATPLSLTAIATGAHGTATLSADLATITFVPDANFNGDASFSYSVSDGILTSTGQVTVTVTPVNDAPVAQGDALATTEDTAASVDVLANDTDVDLDALVVTGNSVPAHGTVVFAGSVATYTPAANFNGADSFSYSISDGNGGIASATVAVTVAAVNDAPVANPDTLVTTEDTAGSVDVAFDDTDADLDALAISAVTQGAHGAVTFVGTVATYTPAPNFNGVDTFTYTISDGNGGSATAAVAVTVTAINDAPVALDDTLTTAEDTAGSVNVLANDSDVDGDTLSVTGHTNPAHGGVTFAGGVATYTPVANFHGADAFTYALSDGHGGTATGTVTVTVTSVNDAPVANADVYSTNEDAVLTADAATGVLANDTDVDADPLTAALVTGPTHGTLALTAAGAFTYTPGLHFIGTDTFTYKASDGTAPSGLATVTIHVSSVEHAPVAVADAYTTAEDTLLTVAAATGVLANDTDLDSDPLTAILVAGPAHGTLALAATGAFTYTPAANFNGTDSFTYKANDGQLDSGTATATLTITAVNDAPVAVADNLIVLEDTAGSVNVLGNDTDADSDPLTVTAAANGSHGTVTFASPNLTYTPAANFNGTDTVTYTVSDGHGGTATGTVHVIVTPVNDAPVANADAINTNEDTAGSVNAVANDTDVDGDTLTIASVTQGAHGAVTFTSATLTYTPAANFNGTDSFTYVVSDGHGGTAIGTVAVQVLAVNDPPVAVADALTTAEDTAGSVDVLTNDTDADGDTLNVINHTNGAHGTVSTAGGVATYTPAANFHGGDSFTYTVSDGHGGTAVGTVTVTVTSVNDAPVAVADAYTTNEDTTLTVAAAAGVLANDTDVDGDTLTAAVVTGPAHGTLTLNTTGAFTFAPTANFTGADSFTYRASDGTAQSNAVTVTLTITAVNDAPVGVADAYTTAEDTALTIAAATGVLANDTDADGDTLTAAVVTPTTHGALSLATTGAFTYTPVANFHGTDSFTYKASDASTSSAITTVTLTVTSVNDAPVAVADSFSTNENVPLTVTAPGVLANDTDVDGDALSAALVTPTAHGTLALAANGSFVYTPSTNFFGADAFAYKASDGALTSGTVTVTINVGQTEHAPVAVADAYTTAEDTALTTAAATGVLANDTDADSDPLTAVLVTNTVHGTLTLAANGGFTYTPAANFHGADSFTYKANDGQLDSGVVAVSLTITSVNDAPIAVADAYTTAEDTLLTVNAATGVLANDTDVDGDPLTAAVVTNPAHGTLVLAAAGSFTYAPGANFNGPDSFTYRASDGTTTSTAVTVALTVTAVNDLPIAVDDNVSGPEDQALVASFASLVANDSDVDGDALTITATGGLPAHGTVALSTTNQTVTYTPSVLNFNGTDSFTYTVSDGHGGTASATIHVTITPVNDAPVAVQDAAFATPINTAADFDVIANDTDVDTAQTSLVPVIVTPPAHGVATVVARKVHYVPTTAFTGADSFQYKANDGALSSANTITDTITVTQPNRPPVANDDSELTNQNASLSFTLTGSDPDNDTFTFELVTAPQNGTVDIDPNTGASTYTPSQDFTGSDTFTFLVRDSHNVASAVATVTINVAAVVPFCGDGIRNNDERCDDGNKLDGDGCDNDCNFSCGANTGASGDAVDPATGHCYAFYDATVNESYASAAAQCVQFGGHLATVANTADNDVIVKALSGQAVNSWIGANNIQSSGEHWITGEPIGAFTAFATGQPKQITGDTTCLTIDGATGKWSTQGCTNQGGTTVGHVCEFGLFRAQDEFTVAAANQVGTNVITADFNGDGFADLAFIVPATSQIGVMLGDGVGGFGPTQLTAALTAVPTAIGAGDLDGDGKAELLSASILSKIGVHISNGDGTFKPVVQTSVISVAGVGAGGITGIVVADFLHSGKPGVVLSVGINIAGGPPGNTVNILTGDGTGALLSPQAFQLGAARPSAVAVGRLNNDGFLDIVSANATGSSFSVILSNVNGGYNAPVTTPLASAPSSVALGDIDGDGFLDVAFGTSAVSTVTTILNDQSGAFRAPVTTVVDAGITSVALFDLDGDRRAELVASSATSQMVSVAQNNGEGFSSPVRVGLPGHAATFALADFDRDNIVDIAVAGDTSTFITELPGTGVSFGRSSYGRADQVPKGIAVGDLNGDGRLDVVTANSTANTVTVTLNNGGGFLAPPISIKVGSTPLAVAVGDLDKDGRLDIVVANSGSNTVTVIMNGPNGLGAPVSIAVGAKPTSVVIADFNQDLFGDIAVTDNAAAAGVGVLLNKATTGSTFSALTTFTAAAGSVMLTVGDVNKDTFPDLVVANQGGVSTSILLGKGNGAFTTAVNLPALREPVYEALVDLTGDKFLDLVTVDHGDSSVLVRKNKGDGTFGAAVRTAVIGSTPLAVAVGDWDQDGNPDFAVAHGSGPLVTLLRNDSTGAVLSSEQLTLGTGGADIHAFDFDGDGRPDLCVADDSSDGVEVLLGRARE